MNEHEHDQSLPTDSWKAALNSLIDEMPAQTSPTSGLTQPMIKPPEEEILSDPGFSYDGYQVVRGEYFAHLQEPCVTFADCKIGFNKACVKKLPDVGYVQVLVNRNERKMVIRPSTEDMKDSFPWQSATGKPRSITCRLFYAMMVDMMGWNPNYRYKLIGKPVRSQKELILVFNLEATEIFRRELERTEDGEEKWRTSRKPVYPDEWKDQFGLPVDENQRVFQINIFDGYAVFGLKDKITPVKEAVQEPSVNGGQEHEASIGSSISSGNIGAD